MSALAFRRPFPMAGPSDTVDHLTQAINRGDLEAALALYEPNAVLVVQPGHLACGTTQLREALTRFVALEPTLRSEVHEVIAAGDLALYAGRWTLRGMDPNGAWARATNLVSASRSWEIGRAHV